MFPYNCVRVASLNGEQLITDEERDKMDEHYFLDRECQETRLKRYRKFFSRKLASFEHPETDFFYVESRYTHALLQEKVMSKEELDEWTGNLLSDFSVACILNDRLWDKEGKMAEYMADREVYHVLSTCEGQKDYERWDGGVAFTDPVEKCFDAVDALGDIHYCGFCDTCNLYDITWYKHTDPETGVETTFAVLKVDTERG